MAFTQTPHFLEYRLRLTGSTFAAPEASAVFRELLIAHVYEDDQRPARDSEREAPMAFVWDAEAEPGVSVLGLLPYPEVSYMIYGVAQDYDGKTSSALSDTVGLSNADLTALKALVDGEKTARGI